MCESYLAVKHLIACHVIQLHSVQVISGNTQQDNQKHQLSNMMQIDTVNPRFFFVFFQQI